MKCITYFMLLPSSRFTLDALLVLGAFVSVAVAFFWALNIMHGNYVLKKNNKMHLKHLINFFPLASRRAQCKKGATEKFHSSFSGKCPGSICTF